MIAMKNLFFVTAFIVIVITINLNAQKASLELTFRATFNSINVSPDSVLITNDDLLCDTTLYGQDSILVLDYTSGMEDFAFNGRKLYVSQNYPNPFISQTEFKLYVPGNEQIVISVNDNNGREVMAYKCNLHHGVHKFSFFAGKSGLYFINVAYQGMSNTIKAYCLGGGNNMEYRLIKLGHVVSPSILKTNDAISSFGFNYGDQLTTTAYYQTYSKTFTFVPLQDTIIVFDFTGSVCPPTVTYLGQVYSTVLIGNQCWMAENINVGTRIDGNVAMANNGVIEKYCYGDIEAHCNIYGGMYQWDELMQYTNVEGSQGICPPGWHVATDSDFKTLAGIVDSQYGIGDPEWEKEGARGLDAGGNLKETGTTHWFAPNTGATNSSGFTALPSGYALGGGGFYDLGYYGDFYTSSEYQGTRAWSHSLDNNSSQVGRYNADKADALAVRCIMN